MGGRGFRAKDFEYVDCKIRVGGIMVYWETKGEWLVWSFT